MTPQVAIVLGTLVIVTILFVSEKLRVDLIAVLVMSFLVAVGILTPTQGVSGFANTATITVGAMFILSAGLQRTGAVNVLGRYLTEFAGDNEIKMTLAFMIVAAGISGFINNTAAVAVFLPLAINVARDIDVSPSRLLMPLSFASMFGGTCTLIGTSTNILVNGIVQQSGLPDFSMFEFLPLGLAATAVGIPYMMLFGRHHIPDRQSPRTTLTDRYALRQYLSEVVLPPNSPLIDRTLEEAQLDMKFDLTIVDIIRDQEDIRLPSITRHLQEGDHLLVRSDIRTLLQIQQSKGWRLMPWSQYGEETLAGESYALAEAAIGPRSELVGQTLRGIDFRRRYGIVALGLQRRGEAIRGKIAQEKLQPGDLLLLYGEQDDINQLYNHPDFLLLLDVPNERLRREKAPLALGIIALVVLAAALNIMPIMISAIAGCIAMVLTGVLSFEEAYGALDSQVLVMLAGILSLGVAMETTGTAEFIADITINTAGPYGLVALVSVFYFLTSGLTQIMSNNATAALLAPIAISVASGLGVNPKPFLVAVTFAASSSFMTPIGYQTNTMIYGPGGYRFSDFTRVGGPLNILLWIVATVAIPMIWPF